jgi:8-oxo-dGTP diphosphatase
MANLQLGDTTTSAKAFFLKEGKVLLVKPTGSEDRYDIPGGKIKFGESKEQGVHRECLEEIGLKIKKAKYIDKDYTRDKIYFLVTDWSGEIVLQVEEIEKYRWVPIERVQEYYLTKTAYNGLLDYLLKELGGV